LDDNEPESVSEWYHLRVRGEGGEGEGRGGARLSLMATRSIGGLSIEDAMTNMAAEREL